MAHISSMSLVGNGDAAIRPVKPLQQPDSTSHIRWLAMDHDHAARIDARRGRSRSAAFG
jgi:hypothetical protein